MSASYTSEALGSGELQIKTHPAFVAPLFIVVLDIVILAVVFLFLVGVFGFKGFVVWAILAGFLYMLFFKVGSWNKGRKPCSIKISTTTITLDDGTVLNRSDIASLHMVAPKAAQVTFHSGMLSGGGTFGGMSATGGTSQTLSNRSWRVEAEAKGNVYVLCGGLTEPVARGVMFEIGKVMG